MREQIWVTKDGRKIPVGEMHEGHAKNALRMMIARHRLIMPFILFLEVTLKHRHDVREEAEAALLNQIDKEFWDDEGRYGLGRD